MYDKENQMIKDGSYNYTDRRLNLDHLFLAGEDFYTSMKQVSVNKENGSLECQVDGQNIEIENIKIKRDIHGIDFIDFIDEVFIKSKTDDHDDRRNELHPQQIKFYNSKGIKKEEYWIEWNDPVFYSTISDFSVLMMKKIEDLIKERNATSFLQNIKIIF